MTRVQPNPSPSFVVRKQFMSKLIAIFCVLVSVGTAAAQQPSSSSTSSSSSASSSLPSSISADQLSRNYEIRGRFLEQQQAALLREFRQVERCIQDATLNLRDVRGQVNRTAQTDLENCSARAVELQRKSKILERKGVRLSNQVQSEIFILQGLIKDYQVRQSFAGASSSD